MEHWVFGARCRKNMARYHNNVALVHKTANILDKMPKSVQGRAKELIHEMYLSPTRKAALEAYDQFIASYQAKYPKATDCLEKDKEWLFTFYDFPAQHWSIFGRPTPLNRSGRCRTTVRLRTPANQRLGSRIATLTMVFKLGIQAQKHWRRLNGSALLPKVVTGVPFIGWRRTTRRGQRTKRTIEYVRPQTAP
jgi:putative transposase